MSSDGTAQLATDNSTLSTSTSSPDAMTSATNRTQFHHHQHHHTEHGTNFTRTLGRIGQHTGPASSYYQNYADRVPSTSVYSFVYVKPRIPDWWKRGKTTPVIPHGTDPDSSSSSTQTAGRSTPSAHHYQSTTTVPETLVKENEAHRTSHSAYHYHKHNSAVSRDQEVDYVEEFDGNGTARSKYSESLLKSLLNKARSSEHGTFYQLMSQLASGNRRKLS